MAEGTGPFTGLQGSPWAADTGTSIHQPPVYLRGPGILSTAWLPQDLPVSLQTWPSGSSR